MIDVNAILPILPGDVVYFSANASSDQDGNITDYYWEFGDGTAATGNYVGHKYNKVGNYTVTLLVVDNDGLSDKKTTTIEVVPIPIINLSIIKTNISKVFSTGRKFIIFNVSITGTQYHAVKIDDIEYTEFIKYKVGNEGGGNTGSIYFDVDGDGYVSAGDYIHYYHLPNYSLEEEYLIYRLRYKNHHHAILGEVIYFFS